MSDDVFKIDQFTVVTDIAPGQVSDVFEVIEEGSGKTFALKLLRDEVVTDPTHPDNKTILTQFKQEFKLGEILDHPNLVRVHEMKFKVQTLMPVKDPVAYFTMDYFRSQNLGTAMNADPLGTQRRIQKVLEQICEALGYVHSKGWIHRDIKPDNLLMTKSGEARLIDFSLACKIKKKSKIIQGTRTYIAPETIKKQKAVPQTDMYSLGVTLYELLAGQPPFTGASPNDLLRRHISTKPNPPSDLNSNVSPELDRLVLKLMAKTPGERHESMEDLIADIRNTRFFKEEIADSSEQEDTSDQLGGIVKTLDSRADAARSKEFEANPELAKQYEEQMKTEAAIRAKTKADRARAVQQESGDSTDTPEPPPPAAAPQQPAATPVAPMMPGMPVVPMMPGMPAAPMLPGMPAAPMMPGMPAAPMMPGMPAAPMMPGMPAAPMMPGMPAAPMMPGMPAAPPTPGVPPAPPTPGMPPAPPTPGTPAPEAPDGAGGAAPPATPPAPLPGQPPPAAPPPQQPQLPPASNTPPEANDDDLPLMEELPEIE